MAADPRQGLLLHRECSSSFYLFVCLKIPLYFSTKKYKVCYFLLFCCEDIKGFAYALLDPYAKEAYIVA